MIKAKLTGIAVQEHFSISAPLSHQPAMKSLG